MAKGMQLRFDDGWAKFQNAIDPKKVTPKIEQRIGKATLRNLLFMRKQVRKAITEGRYAADSELTETIKGSTKPLVGVGKGGGGLFAGITHDQFNAYQGFVGVKRDVQRKDGGSLADLAELLHEGYEIDVTDEMRVMFYSIFKAQQGLIPASELEGRAAFIFRKARGRTIHPLNEDTVALEVPPRPFIRVPFEDKKNQAVLIKNWSTAAQEALKP